MIDHDKLRSMMKRSLLSTIYQGVKMIPAYYRESPERIYLCRHGENGHYGLSSTLAGVAYCVATEYNTADCTLRINRQEVAHDPAGIMLWMVENAPKTLREAVRLTIEYEKENA